MSGWIKRFLTATVALLLSAATLLLVNVLFGGPLGYWWVALSGAIFGLAYGVQAAILEIYDLSRARGWAELIVDVTWSLPNTILGFVIGNAVYPWFGDISKSDSKHAGWIVYMPPATKTSGFGVTVLQIWGTVNLGGQGQHEKMHLLQARIFGLLYLPLFALNYVINFVIQSLWTITLGGILWLAKVRAKPYLRPSGQSVVGGFFGWIYFATVFEYWAYKAGNP